MMLLTLIQARASSSVTRQYSRHPRPRPPYSLGIVIPKKPISASLARRDSGISRRSGSYSLAIGKTSLIANEYDRSEEHTSELQSLMRKSYAVLCLKKKKTPNTVSNAH